MIEVYIDKKKYDNNFELSNIDFTFNQEECICLIGANGSGKTTLINCMLGLTYFEGKVIYEKNVIDPLKNSQFLMDYKHDVAYISDTTNLFEFLTPCEYIDLLFQNSEGAIDKQLFFSLLDIFKITQYKDVRISELSFGTKKKIQIILQITRRPKYIIFDEPTNGLDPEMIITLKILIKNYLKNQAGILFSTHQLNFCKDLGTKVLLLQDGKCLLKEETKELYKKYHTDDLEIIYKDLNKSYYQKVGDSIAKLEY